MNIIIHIHYIAVSYVPDENSDDIEEDEEDREEHKETRTKGIGATTTNAEDNMSHSGVYRNVSEPRVV